MQNVPPSTITTHQEVKTCYNIITNANILNMTPKQPPRQLIFFVLTGHRSFSSVASQIVISAGGLGLNSLAGQIGTVSQWLATVAAFLRSCVAQALSRGDGPRHSSHAFAQYRDYNENLIFYSLACRRLGAREFTRGDALLVVDVVEVREPAAVEPFRSI